MSEPVFNGMPPTDRVLTVTWQANGPKVTGKIRCGGVCNDSYDRIEHHTGVGGQIITLQHAAMESFLAASAAVAARRAPKALIICTGTARACSYQASLYRSDPTRYANPDTSAHCRALAIDVSMNQSARQLRLIHKALMARGWHQARPSDEPWHFSFGIEV